ncbi:MAG: metallophosphoesterase family protein [Aggregatilineales bacterium]
MTQPLARFIHISDTHLLRPGQGLTYGDIPPEYAHFARQVLALPYDSAAALRALVAAINALPFKPDFTLHTGDVAAQIGAPQDYEAFQELLAGLPAPVIYTPGNHDDSVALQRFLLGQTPAQPYDHAHAINGVQLVCLDTSLPGAHAGRLSVAQVDWLKAQLAPDDDRPLLVALHHHPLPLGADWLDSLILDNGEALHIALKRAGGRPRAVLYGHIHAHTHTVRDGVLYASAPSAWCEFRAWPGDAPPALLDGAAPGFNLVTVYPDRIAVLHYRSPLPFDRVR